LGVLCINYKAAENQFFELGTKRNDKETRPKLSDGGEGVTERERERERERLYGVIMSSARAIGDYVVTEQIGAGSFAVVWKAHHKQQLEFNVAIKEIITERLNKKLQESLRSEIAILRRTDHPNIIRLHDIVEVSSSPWFCFPCCGKTNRVWNFMHLAMCNCRNFPI
jgi:serine/threonine protein kinase